MSIYNGEKFLTEAVESILRQSYPYFEFLIIDDGSTDNTWDILNEYTDERIKLFRNHQNIGLTKSLNIGLKLAKGKYIARMDADDTSYPNRLQKQFLFLEAHPQITLVGSWSRETDYTHKTFRIINCPTKTYLVKWRLLFSNPFAHSSVMFRSHGITQLGGYNEKLKYAQDFDLWSRISHQYEAANIPKILINRKIYKKGISVQNKEAQKNTACQISHQNIVQLLGENLSGDTLQLIDSLYNGCSIPINLNNFSQLILISDKLMKRFLIKYKYSQKKIHNEIKTEIITHLFALIKNSHNNFLQKVGLTIYCLNKVHLNFFRAIWIFFTRRTRFGTFLFHFNPY